MELYKWQITLLNVLNLIVLQVFREGGGKFGPPERWLVWPPIVFYNVKW